MIIKVKTLVFSENFTDQYGDVHVMENVSVASIVSFLKNICSDQL